MLAHECLLLSSLSLMLTLSLLILLWLPLSLFSLSFSHPCTYKSLTAPTMEYGKKICDELREGRYVAIIQKAMWSKTNQKFWSRIDFLKVQKMHKHTHTDKCIQIKKVNSKNNIVVENQMKIIKNKNTVSQSYTLACVGHGSYKVLCGYVVSDKAVYKPDVSTSCVWCS